VRLFIDRFIRSNAAISTTFLALLDSPMTQSSRGLLVVWFLLVATSLSAASPNVVLIFTDDQAYGDLGCYGGQHVVTPNLDRLATQGMRFTDFYVAQAVCGASRAALLSGCYPNRIGIQGAPGPSAKFGISDNELLLSEVLKSKGYATAAVGKWHLGHHKRFLPKQHGFDSYFGLPYSNDMWPFHPEGAQFPDLPLIEGDTIINPKVTSADQTQLTKQYTQHAVEFIRQNREKPFFLYLAHSMPHVPLHASESFQGKTGKGLFADVIAEVDDSVGQVLATLDELHLADNTLVIFTTDNGPWQSYGNHAGSAGPLREGKGTTFDGGVRVPCLMRWPGQIPQAAVCRELAATIDIVPTIAGLVGAKLSAHPIDGRDIWPLMTGDPDAKTPHESYLYYWGNELQAIRSGRFKLHFPHSYRSLTGTPGRDGKPGGYSEQKIGLALYDLEADIGERDDVQAQHPDVVARLQKLAEQARIDLGDTGRKGTGVRPPGRVE
jgi:arylsulfatase A-like enzyme